MTIIPINLRTIPEINNLFSRRPNKKDSFNRWFNKLQNNAVVSFHIDGDIVDAEEA